MRQIPVTSSMIAAAAYDDERQELVLTFKSGATWRYGSETRPFTPEDVDRFEGASSAGQHFLQDIKGQWPERRV